MGVNRGKEFEKIVQECFEKTPYVSIDRLHDQTTGYKGSSNICDFIVYREPYEFYFECKSVHGNTLSIYSRPKLGKDGRFHGFYGNISDTQWEGLLEKSKIPGVIAGIICWWIDKDVTLFMPIQVLQQYYDTTLVKSIRYDNDDSRMITARGIKKRIYFDYDMEALLNEITE
jgi:hypothetical protein